MGWYDALPKKKFLNKNFVHKVYILVDGLRLQCGICWEVGHTKQCTENS